MYIWHYHVSLSHVSERDVTKSVVFLWNWDIFTMLSWVFLSRRLKRPPLDHHDNIVKHDNTMECNWAGFGSQTCLSCLRSCWQLSSLQASNIGCFSGLTTKDIISSVWWRCNTHHISVSFRNVLSSKKNEYITSNSIDYIYGRVNVYWLIYYSHPLSSASDTFMGCHLFIFCTLKYSTQ